MATNGKAVDGGVAVLDAPAKAKAKGPDTERAALKKLDLRIFKLKVVGDAPLITNKWSEKAKQQMRDKQGKKAKSAKEAKDAEQCYLGTLYDHPDGGYGFPSVAFKSAAVDACSSIDGITKVQARGAFHIMGDLVKVVGKPQMREDMVRVGMGVADLRYRAEFREWSAELTIRYNANVLSIEQIINLFNVGGFAVGVGEWRPQRDGSFGMFHVKVD